MNNEEFYIGQKFYIEYPPEAAFWCNDNQASIIETEPEMHVYVKEEDFYNEETGEMENKRHRVEELVRTFLIVEKPKPSEENLKKAVRDVRNRYLEKFVDPVVSNPLRWADMVEDDQQLYVEYRLYLLSYTDKENWWKKNPLTMPEWEIFHKHENEEESK